MYQDSTLLVVVCFAGQKKNLKETPWFPQYYIGWIGIGNCDQKTSNIYTVSQINFQHSDRLNLLKLANLKHTWNFFVSPGSEDGLFQKEFFEIDQFIFKPTDDMKKILDFASGKCNSFLNSNAWSIC